MTESWGPYDDGAFLRQCPLAVVEDARVVARREMRAAYAKASPHERRRQERRADFGFETINDLTGYWAAQGTERWEWFRARMETEHFARFARSTDNGAARWEYVRALMVQCPLPLARETEEARAAPAVPPCTGEIGYARENRGISWAKKNILPTVADAMTLISGRFVK